MATYTDIATLITALAAGKAFTDEKAQALAENPLAISEGSPGAPRVLGRSLDVYMGYYTITDTPTVFTDLDQCSVFRASVICPTVVGRSLAIALSNDNGSSYGSDQTLIGTGYLTTAGELVFDITTGAAVYVSMSTASGTSLTLTVPSDCNAIRIHVAGGAGDTAYMALYSLGGVA